MAECIAVINAGSSSIKFAIYEMTVESPLVFKGQIEGIGVDPHLKIVDAQGAALDERKFVKDGFGHDAAMREIIVTSRAQLNGSEVVGFGHRVEPGACFVGDIRAGAEMGTCDGAGISDSMTCRQEGGLDYRWVHACPFRKKCRSNNTGRDERGAQYARVQYSGWTVTVASSA